MNMLKKKKENNKQKSCKGSKVHLIAVIPIL